LDTIMAETAPAPSPSALTLPPIETFHTLPLPEQLHAIDLLFEPHPQLHALVAPGLPTETTGAPFPSYAALVKTVYDALSTLAHDVFSSPDAPQDKTATTLYEILGAHPRLGAANITSAQSAGEQAHLATAAEDQARELARLNAEYEARFPGLRFVTFTNGRSCEIIMAEMRSRIGRADELAEVRAIIRAVCNIANNRAGKLLAAQAAQ
jgi:2-oxo-4-hydroxy-4-carboxy--5-ureidoimidazoline (OHCU) decarboxylase